MKEEDIQHVMWNYDQLCKIVRPDSMKGMNKLDNGKFIPTGIDSSGNNKYSYSGLSRKYPQIYLTVQVSTCPSGHFCNS